MTACRFATATDEDVERWDQLEIEHQRRAQCRLLGIEYLAPWVRARKVPRRKPFTVVADVVRITPIVSWRDVVDVVAARYGLDPVALAQPDGNGSRTSKYCRARYIAMWVLRKRGGSYPQIGIRMGGRDHSSVINGIRRIEAMASSEERAFVDSLCPVVEVLVPEAVENDHP